MAWKFQRASCFRKNWLETNAPVHMNTRASPFSSVNPVQLRQFSNCRTHHDRPAHLCISPDNQVGLAARKGAIVVILSLLLTTERVPSSFVTSHLAGQQTFPFNPGTRFPLYRATQREPFYLRLTIAGINRWSFELRYFFQLCRKRVARARVHRRKTFSPWCDGGKRREREKKKKRKKERETRGDPVIKNNPLSVATQRTHSL